MPSNTDCHSSVNSGWDDFLGNIAAEVDGLVVQPSIMAEFRKQIRPFAERWEAYRISSERSARMHREHWENVKQNPAWQNQEAGPPEEGWEWDKFYLLNTSVSYGPVYEMPARYGPDLVAKMREHLARNCGKMQEMAMLGMYTSVCRSSDYHKLQEAIAEEEVNVAEIQGQLDELNLEQRNKAWIKTPPLPNRRLPGPYWRVKWWEYFEMSGEQVFGCWRPPMEASIEHPVKYLMLKEDGSGLPRPKNREEEYERYYVALSSIHDTVLTGCERIDDGIWPNELAESVRFRLSAKVRPYGPSEHFVRSALGRVRQDLQTKRLLDDGPGSARTEQKGEPVGRLTEVSADNEGNEDFLLSVATDVHRLVRQRANMRFFREQIKAFYDLLQEASSSQDAQIETIHRKLREDHTYEPETLGQSFYESLLSLLTMPSNLHTEEMAEFAGPSEEDAISEEAKSQADYVVLAIIHDKRLKGPRVPKIGTVIWAKNEDWVDSTWDEIKKRAATQDGQADIKCTFDRVEADLPERVLEGQQGIEPVVRPAEPEMSGRVADRNVEEGLLEAVAYEVDEIITTGVVKIGNDKERIDPTVALARFREHIDRFLGEHRAFCEARDKSVEQQRDEYERIRKSALYRDGEAGPPTEGLIWCDDFMLPAECLDPTPGRFEDEPLAGWVRPDAKLPPDPTIWPQYHNDVLGDTLRACYYATVAIIHDYKIGRKSIYPQWHQPSAPMRDLENLKLTEEQYTGAIMWFSIENNYSGFEGSTVMEALQNVTADLVDNCRLQVRTEPEQKCSSDKETFQKGWKPPKGYVGSKEIEHDYHVPRTTLQGWQERDPPSKMIVRDPQTHENYYPESWIKKKLKNYKPRKRI